MTVAIDAVKRVLVVGAGQMGAQIAMQAALHGYAVTLNDLSADILQTTPQMLLNVVEFGMTVQEAIEAPRVRAYRDRLVDVEGRIPAAVREGLAARGHQVNVLEDWSWVVGGGQGIRRDPESGALQGGADPRRDGYALAV